MTVKIVYEVPPLSTNKPQTNNHKNIKEIETSKVCYKYNRGENSEAYVLNPVIDYLTITVPIDDEELKLVIYDNVFGLIKDEGEKGFEYLLKSDLKPKSFSSYAINCILKDFSSLIAIQARPNTPKHRFLRIVMVPSKLTSNDIAKLSSILEIISLGEIDFKYVVKKGLVTRADWAVDIANADASDILLTKPNSKRKSWWIIGEEGGVETNYIMGNDNKVKAGSSKAYLYNKTANQIVKGGVIEKAVPLITRVEIRTKPEMSLVKMGSHSKKMLNPFAKYEVVDFFASQPRNEGVKWCFFGDACRLRGISTTLAMLPASEQEAYSKALQVSLEKCWRKDELWKSAEDNVNELMGAL